MATTKKAPKKKPVAKKKSVTVKLTGLSINNALKGNKFWLDKDSVDAKIIQKATAAGYVRRNSHTQAEWTTKGAFKFFTAAQLERNGLKKPTKTKTAPKLVWKKLPEGGEYAGYKLGTIRRYKGKYSYSTAFNTTYNANGLADAKKKIDSYTAKTIGK